MNLKSLNLSVVAATLFSGALCVAPEAKAFTITSTASFTNLTTDLSGAPLLILQRFDSALAAALLPPLTATQALTRVEVFTRGTLRSSGTVTNTSAAPSNFTFRAVGELSLTKDLGAPPSIVDPISSMNPIDTIAPGSIIGSQLYTNLAPNTPTPFPLSGLPRTITRSTTQIITDIAEVAQFLGFVDFEFAPNTITGFSVGGGGGNVSANLTTFVDSDVIITYTVETIPFEFNPAIGVGILGLAWGANKLRKAKKASSN